MKLSNNATKRKGFTLVELVVVITIIGILMAIAVPKLAAYRVMAQHSGVDQTASHVATATMAYLASSAVSSQVNAEVSLTPLTPANGGGYSEQVTQYFNCVPTSNNATPTAGYNATASETQFAAFMENAMQGTSVAGMSFIPVDISALGVAPAAPTFAVCADIANPYKMAGLPVVAVTNTIAYNSYFVGMYRSNNHDDLYVVTSYSDLPTVAVTYTNGTR